MVGISSRIYEVRWSNWFGCVSCLEMQGGPVELHEQLPGRYIRVVNQRVNALSSFPRVPGAAGQHVSLHPARVHGYYSEVLRRKVVGQDPRLHVQSDLRNAVAVPGGSFAVLNAPAIRTRC